MPFLYQEIQIQTEPEGEWTFLLVGSVPSGGELSVGHPWWS